MTKSEYLKYYDHKFSDGPLWLWSCSTFVGSCVQDVRLHTTVGHHGVEHGGAVEELLVSILQFWRIATIERSAVL